ncbi:hypothetical protein [Mycolicibacterium sp.]|uniref:hypothetical protein n=1 Tax=Mycolicibacterium sp. TaxID=2320850 RepID=UPI003D14A06D
MQHFANDLPSDQATDLWASPRTASTTGLDTPATRAARHDIPSWYFISSGDQIITPTAEHARAERAGSHVTNFPGGSYLSLVSNPDAVSSGPRCGPWPEYGGRPPRSARSGRKPIPPKLHSSRRPLGFSLLAGDVKLRGVGRGCFQRGG